MKSILRTLKVFALLFCLVFPALAQAQNDSISSSFNANPIAGNNYIWFTCFFKANNHAAGTTFYFRDSHIRFMANGTNYNISVPKGQISFVEGNTLPNGKETYVYNTASNTWIIRIPKDKGGNYLASGLAFQVPAGGFPGSISPVTWDGQFSSNAEGVDIDWRWSAAVYTNFTTNYELLNVDVAADDGNIGQPINYTVFAIPGATGTGSGGNLYTGVPSAYRQIYTPVRLGTASKYTFVALSGTYMNLSNTNITGDIAICKNGSLMLSSPTTVNGNVYMSTSTTYTINGVLNGSLYTNQDLTQVETDAMNAYNDYKNMTPSTIYTTWNSSLTINGINGLNVINVTSINLSGGQYVTLNGGSNASYVINVSGGFTMSGDAWIKGGGNVDGSKIIINITGNGTDVTSHINNFIEGTILAPSRKVNLHNVTGQVICGGASMTAMSGGVNTLRSFMPPKANLATVGQFMFKDNNLNGKKDAGDTSVVNGTVILYDSLNNILGTRMTDYRGFYLFDSIPMPENGTVNFRIKFINPVLGYSFVSAFAPGSDSTNQSVADPATGFSPFFTLKAGQVKLTINSGIKINGVLPINLLSFSGINARNNNLLYWSTAGEPNLEKFELEQSSDGERFFKIGEIQAAGPASSRNDYSFTHLNPGAGKNYYRLKLVDAGNKNSYSKTIVISKSETVPFLISTYPNPVKERVYADLFMETPGIVSMRLYNNNGAVIKTTSVQLNKGLNQVRMDQLDQLSTGIYILKISNCNSSRTIQILKGN